MENRETSPILLPVVETQPAHALSFEHLGRRFFVQVAPVVENTARHYQLYSILNEARELEGQIEGFRSVVGTSVNFTPFRSDNILKHRTGHARGLMRTAIGEIVAQSDEQLVWHSSPLLTDDGSYMYRKLVADVERPGSRFYDRLEARVWTSKHNGEAGLRFSLKKKGVA